MERFRGKVAVVTGASSGIGAAVVERLTEEGLQVVGLARRKERLQALSKQLEDKNGTFYPFVADVTKEEEILNGFKWIKENVGPIHILINSAGVSRLTTLIDGNTKLWRDVLNTNVLALCVATRETVKDMKVNNVAGHIVHINSEAGHKVINMPKINVYTASKHVVTALTETLRQELNSSGSKIKVTSISPGIVDTEIFEIAFKESGYDGTSEGRQVVNRHPYLQSKDIADAILYVLGTPLHVQIHELRIKPIGEQF